MRDDACIEPAISVSSVLRTLKPSSIDYVFVHPDIENKAKSWLKANRQSVLEAAASEEEKS